MADPADAKNQAVLAAIDEAASRPRWSAKKFLWRMRHDNPKWCDA